MRLAGRAQIDAFGLVMIPKVDLLGRSRCRLPNAISILPPAAGPAGEPRSEAYEALHAVPANLENTQQTLFHQIISRREALVLRHGDLNATS